MSDIINNKEELMEVVREAADAVFDAWFRVMEREEKKKREQVPLVKGYQEERLEGETAIQYGERMIKEFFKEDPGATERSF